MRINIDEILNNINRLEQLYSSTTNENKRIEIRRDINFLYMIYNYISFSNKQFDMRDELFNGFMCEKNRETISFFCKFAPRLKENLVIYSGGIRLPWKYSRDSEISNKEYDRLVSSFLIDTETRLYEIYDLLKKKNMIELNPRKYNFHRYAYGLNVHILSQDISYILSRFNNKISTTSILPHEIGHSLLLDGTTSTRDLVHKNGSVFCESYSIFIEMIFFDYLKSTRYHKNAFLEEHNKLSSFLAYIENHFTSILKLEEISISDNESIFDIHERSDIFQLKLMMSTLLAMYFTDLYRNNKDRFNCTLNDFISMFGHCTDEEIMSYFGLENMVKSTNNVLENYVRTYKK